MCTKTNLGDKLVGKKRRKQGPYRCVPCACWGTPSLTRISTVQMLSNTSSCSSVTLPLHSLECLTSEQLRNPQMAS